MTNPSPDPIDELEAETAMLATAREKLTPLMDAVRQMVPRADDVAIMVTFEIRGVRSPMVISTDRYRVADDLAHYVEHVRKQRPHDRGRG